MSALFSCFFVATGRAQMVPPLDIPLVLSGNFMELRSDHFHSGLDIRTNGKEGLAVRAVKDGFVSRIKVSPWGYGKALYLEHPDGTTTVYGHLQRYAPDIAEVVLDAQYAAKDFSLDMTLDKTRLPVKQGDLIAWSGNSGGSGGPHLHFEVRNSAQHALDPEAHGIDLKDAIAPELNGVRVYPLTPTSRVQPYPAGARGFAVQQSKAANQLKIDTVTCHGTVGFALNVIDRYDGSQATCGPRKLELFVDEERAFTVNLDHVDFSVQRFCNAHMDYGLYKELDMNYQRLYKLPTNKLDIYGNEALQGRVTITAGKVQHIRMVATDANGNISELEFHVRGATAEEAANMAPPATTGVLFEAGSSSSFQRTGFRLSVPADALYEDLDFQYDTRPAPPQAKSVLHRVHNKHTPLHTAATITLKADSIAPALADKALLLRWEEDGKHQAQGGTWENGWVRANVKSFGDYCVMLDTVPPQISPVGLKPSMKGVEGFTLRVLDNLSGVDKWNATLDGQWMLMDHDPKNKVLSHRFDKHTSAPGEHVFRVEVQDERGNKSVFSFTFTR